MNTDFYQILGVPKNATQLEIKKAYRKKILQCHPDKNKSSDAIEKFRKIQIAYETLSDEKKKAKYDAFDSLGNKTIIKNMFMYYQELIIEFCEKYQIDDKQKEELVMLFNSDDFMEEIKNNDIIAANNKIYHKITQYGKKILWKKISKNSFIAGFMEFFISWLNK